MTITLSISFVAHAPPFISLWHSVFLINDLPVAVRSPNPFCSPGPPPPQKRKEKPISCLPPHTSKANERCNFLSPVAATFQAGSNHRAVVITSCVKTQSATLLTSALAQSLIEDAQCLGGGQRRFSFNSTSSAHRSPLKEEGGPARRSLPVRTPRSRATLTEGGTSTPRAPAELTYATFKVW